MSSFNLSTLGYNLSGSAFLQGDSAIVSASGSVVNSGSAIASAVNLDSAYLNSASAVASESALVSASAINSGSIVASGSALTSASAIGSGSAIASGSALAAGSTYIPGSLKVPIIPIEQHQLNVDPNPVLIKKKPAERLQYVQNVSLKFLRPPPPQQPGDITIVQESDVQAPAAPALHVTQKPALPLTPAPLVVRERPPRPPAPIAPRHITIPGKVVPPPPRKVIVERLPQIPAKPQDIIIERWLAYQRRTRNVHFQPAPALIPAPAPKNVLIQWDSPDVDVRQQFNFLGVQQADPAAYVATHGASLADASQLPREVAHFATPAGETLAVNSNSDELPALVGDVKALSLINLNCNGLSQYSAQL